MSNIFQEVSTNNPYDKNILTSTEIGMSSKDSLSTLGNNIDGLIAYVELLISGDGKASATGEPLGNKFFLKTQEKCRDKTTRQEVDRYVYINNVPQRNIPLISSGFGVDFPNLNAFNPMELFQSFFSDANPDCQELKMETMDIYNNKSTESHYVTLMDIKNMDPCTFTNKKNPITNVQCRETFTNLNQDQNHTCFNVPKDPISQLYFASVGVLGIYILYGIMVKNNLLPK
jgi:hypothetical protein